MFPGFRMFGQLLTHNGLAGHAVVADERIRQDENLVLVRRIGERFGVADHPGLEHHFPCHPGRRSTKNVAWMQIGTNVNRFTKTECRNSMQQQHATTCSNNLYSVQSSTTSGVNAILTGRCTFRCHQQMQNNDSN